MSYIGEFPEDFATVSILFTTHAASGAAVAPSTGFEAADVAIFKNGSATEKTSTNGLTMTSPFNGTTGLHCLVIDTSNDTGDSGFWVAGAQYTVVLVPDETVDSLAVVKVIGTFGIELSEVLRPTVAGRQLDVSTGGEAGLDWANIGSPTTAVNLSGTNIDADQVVASVSGAVGSVTGLTASNLDAAVSTRASQTSVDDLPTNAELTTALAGADDAVLAQVALVKAKTDNLPSDPADASDIAAAFVSLASHGDSTWATATGFATAANLATVDTVVDAIKVTTDKLDDTVEDDSGTYRFTANALEQAPTGGGGSAPTVEEIADEVQTRTIAAVTVVNGLAANSVTAAALAADAGTEIGTAVWATGTRRLSDGTNIVLAKGTGVTGFNDLSAAQVNAEADTALADAGVTTTVTGRIDAAISTRLASGSYTAPLDAAGTRAALGMAAANLDTQLDALPTNAELTAGFAAADDATLAALATLSSGISTSFTVLSAHGDSAWSTATAVDANVTSVNGVEVIGTGVSGDEWGPA